MRTGPGPAVGGPEGLRATRLTAWASPPVAGAGRAGTARTDTRAGTRPRAHTRAGWASPFLPSPDTPASAGATVAAVSVASLRPAAPVRPGAGRSGSRHTRH